ncbi:MAG: PQQ-dependent dehydrogenase, methanol/ethanol family [Acidobacteria bacterium]|nr:PQQ-dependent dehydrogenase, methanol/ethanol family [Acidobacteriota bacterium]
MRRGLLLAPALLLTGLLHAQVSFERIVESERKPADWPTYSGSYDGRHFRTLDQITRANVDRLELAWVYQGSSTHTWQATPLVADGVMYFTEGPNNTVAVDAATGREFWKSEHKLPARVNVCCGRVNRGVALLDDKVYMGTLDGYLKALDAATGRVVWEKKIVDNGEGYALTMAPLAVKDKILIGPAGGEYGIRGFLDAYDAATGERAWRFNTVPGPGEKGHETWENDAWKTGGGSAWLTGSYDPELDLIYWGVGNPSPDWNASVRPGDNLYTDSVVALDADTGELRWHFQFTPHDEWDWDAVQVPVLADMEIDGKARKLLLWGNRNGFFYVLDRTDGSFLLGKPFTKQTWAEGLDATGRPIKIPGQGPSEQGAKVYPSVQGGTNWYAPVFSPRTELFYLTAWIDYWGLFYTGEPVYTAGNRYDGSAVARVYPDAMEEKDPGYGAIRAIDPRTGERKWEFKTTEVSESGLLATSTDLLFSGSIEGNFFAIDATDGKLLWRVRLGGRVASSPITYMVGGRQYIAVSSGDSLFAFTLRQ